MFCPKCGRSLPDDSIFCDECGYSLNQKSAFSQQQHTYAVQNSYASQTTPGNKNISGTEKAKTWLERLGLSTMQKVNSIIALVAAVLLLICIDGSLYMWLYLLSAIVLVILVVKKFDFRSILSAVVPSAMLLGLIVTDFVYIAARQSQPAVNYVMQIILAGAVTVIWLLAFHPLFKEQNKKSAVLMLIALICIAINAVFLLISFFVNTRYMGWNFRIPIGNLGTFTVLASYLIFLIDEGKTIRWIMKELRTVPRQVPYQTQTGYSTGSDNRVRYDSSVPDDYVFCSKCGAKVTKGSAFCNRCGSSLTETKQPSQSNGETQEGVHDMSAVHNEDKVCPFCGAILEEDSTFCDTCGNRI